MSNATNSTIPLNFKNKTVVIFFFFKYQNFVLSKAISNYVSHTEVVPLQIFLTSSSMILHIKSSGLQSSCMTPKENKCFVTCRWSFSIKWIADIFKYVTRLSSYSIFHISAPFVQNFFLRIIYYTYMYS